MVHITICICTYRRPQFLGKVLEPLGRQALGGRVTLSIVVCDNDYLQSAKEVVADFAQASGIRIEYGVEPRQNIALARNKAVELATGEYVAFLDDDEVPTDRWLLALLETCSRYGADGAMGSAIPDFEGNPPAWLVKGRFHHRSSHPTGSVVKWQVGRTGNTLLRRSLFTAGEQPFRPDLLSGEDQDFFRRKIEEGHVFVWCEEAITREIIPAARWKRWFLLRRALLRGKMSLLHPTSSTRELLKSLVAIPAYTLALPFSLLLGHHIVMQCLVRAFDHLGRLMGCLGVDSSKEKYVTQ